VEIAIAKYTLTFSILAGVIVVLAGVIVVLEVALGVLGISKRVGGAAIE
jgi:hypothetical protein